jgi:peptide/nickel transport system substrate-binding protein
MKKVTIFLLLIAAAVLCLFNSCQEAEEVKTIVYGTTEKVIDLDPANAYDFHTWEIFWNISEGLLAYKPGTNEIVPGIAESYTMNDAGDEYTFKLREGMKFTDGTPLDAEAVKWSIDRVMDLKGDPSWLVTDFVESVDVVDELTVKFNLTGTIAYFPHLVATVPYYPVNPEIYPKDSIIRDPEELEGGQLVCYGAYKVVSFKRDEEIVMEANPDYFDKAPDVQRIIIRYFADATTMRLALEAGEVDLVFKTLNPSDIADLSANSDFNTFKIPGPYIRYICYETSESVFSNNLLRQAVSALVDREDLVDKVFLGQNAPLYSMVPIGMTYHTDEFKTALGDGNVAKAEEILSGLGYSADNPFTFELWYTPSHYGDTEVHVAEVLKEHFEATDMVKVELKSAEWAAYRDKWSNKEMPMYLLGWYPDYIDPDNYTSAFAGTAGSAGIGINFSDPEWDALFLKEQTNADPNVRKAVFEELQKRWTVDVPTAPLFQGNLFVFTLPNVSGVKIGPTMIFNYNQLIMDTE